MSVLRLSILASMLGCCIGYVVVQRPAEYYNYQTQPYNYQWQTSPYQSYDYQPPDYQPPDPYYPSSYYGNYYYYYPMTYEYPESYNPNPKPHLPYDEGQKLLQVYRLIRVIELFRDPPHKKLTSLDRLVHQLTDEVLQEQLVELLYHVRGYEEVAELERGPPSLKLNSFVNDIGRLLLAIQRALNALDLDDDHHHNYYDQRPYYSHHYPQYKPHGYYGLPKELRVKLRKLRDLADSLTVAQILQELLDGTKIHVKLDLVSNLAQKPHPHYPEEKESKTLVDEPNEKLDVVLIDEELKVPFNVDKVEKPVVVIDDAKEESKSLPSKDEEILDELNAALELYLKQQKLIDSHQAKEKSQEEAAQQTPTVEATTGMPIVTTVTPIPPTTTEATQDSWLGSWLGKGLPGSQTVDVSQPADLIEPVTTESSKPDDENAWVHENSTEKNSLDFDIDQRFQELSSTEKTASPVTHSVPLWLTENSGQQKVESKELESEKQEEGLPESKQEPEEEEEAKTAIKEEEGEAREIPVDEEKLQQVEDEVDGPSKIDLPADLTEHKVKDSTPEPIPVDEQTEPQQPEQPSTVEPSTEEPTTQSPLNVYEVHTESSTAEPREEQPSLPTTAASEPDARRYIKEEVMKVLSLLEEANGFTELKEHVVEQDVDALVDGLSSVDVGVRWSEMISALQKLVTEKQLESGEKIVDVLEHWKEGEAGQLDDGYFNRTYGESEDVENRELVDGEEAELKSIQEEGVQESKGSGDGEQGAEGNTTTEAVDEDRDPRELDVGDEQAVDNSTESPSDEATTTSESSPQEEESTDKLEETTLQPFPADEAEPLALD